MTFDERIAALGVDLSDLPKTYKDAHTWNAFTAAFDWDVMADEKRGEGILAAYVLHLVDIIDRMETRIVNLTLERDSLKECMKYMTYDEDGYLQDSLKIRCENCPFMIDSKCRVREDDDDDLASLREFLWEMANAGKGGRR